VSLRALAFKYRDFPSFRAPQILLNSVSQNLPTVMLAAFFGPAAAGFYALGRRVLSLPASLVSGSVGTVFLPKIAEAGQRGERLRPLIVKGTIGLALVGLVPFGVIVVAGPWLFGVAFGAQWVVAGEYARWLAVWLYFGFVNVPAVQAIPMLGLQGQFLVYEVVVTALRVGTLVIGARVLNSDVGTMALFSGVGAVLNAVLIMWVLVRSDGPVREGLAGELFE
jgi:O-antigen/teichoic acid export membrane protein